METASTLVRHGAHLRLAAEVLARPDLLIAFLVVWGAVAVVAVVLITGRAGGGLTR